MDGMSSWTTKVVDTIKKNVITRQDILPKLMVVSR